MGVSRDGDDAPEMDARGPVGTELVLAEWGVAGETGGGAKREGGPDHVPRPPRALKPPPRGVGT